MRETSRGVDKKLHVNNNSKKDTELMAKLGNEFLYGARVYDKDGDGNEIYNVGNPLIMKDNGDPLALGACNNGFTEAEARPIWDAIVEFAKYAFNKSHAAAYAYNAYQTAWLKLYYPADFLSNCMTISDKDEDILACIKEAKKLGVPILPIDVNKSHSGHVVEVLPDGRKAIRLGFSLIAGISNADAIVSCRATGSYLSVQDFFSRIPGNALNRTKAPNLILAGGLDAIEPNRHTVYNTYFGTIRKENAITEKEMKKAKKAEDKKVISSSYVPKSEMEFCDDVKYAYEVELMKLCISGHPLDKYPYQPWEFVGYHQQCECYAIVRDVKVRQDKSQRTYAFFKAECLEDTRECVMWATDFAKHGTKLVNGKTLLLRGTKKPDMRGNPQFTVAQAIARFNTNTPLNDEAQAVGPMLVCPPVFEDPLTEAYRRDEPQSWDNKPQTIEDILYGKEEDKPTTPDQLFDYC